MKANSVVLVHAGFVDGSGWEEVYKILRKDGYTVAIVQNPTISLADDVAAAKRIIDAQNQVLGNKVCDKRSGSFGMKAKHALFSGAVFFCDVLVATELFGPGFDNEDFNKSTRLRHIIEERPLDGTVTTSPSFEVVHRI